MIEIYTDGACSGNPGPGGYGIVIIYSDGTKYKMSGYEADTTNNKMELLGPITALKMLVHHNKNSNDIILYSDSSYLINGITKWINGWKRNGWKTSNKTNVKNKELWQSLDTLMPKFKSIKWVWVKGHNDNEYNEFCDKLATTAIQTKSGISLTEIS